MRVFLSGAISLVAITSVVAINQCATALQCCAHLSPPSDPEVQLLLGLLGIVLGPNPGTVGLTCLLISILMTAT